MNDAAPSDLAQITLEVDAVLLIQSANVMSEPRSLARLYAAMKSGVPIIPAVMTSAAAEHKSLLYNFEAAKPHMTELSRHLDDDAVVALEAALVEGTGDEKVDTVQASAMTTADAALPQPHTHRFLASRRNCPSCGPRLVGTLTACLSVSAWPTCRWARH